MNKLRNGSFERNSLDFWGAVAYANMIVVDTEQNEGAYSGQVTTTAIDTVTVRHNDNIEVVGGKLLYAEVYLKMDAGEEAALRLRYYDADLNYIGSSMSRILTGSGIWQKLGHGFKTISGAVYTSLEVRYYSTGIGDVFYVDSAYLELISVDELVLGGVELCQLYNIVATGDTADTPEFLGGYRVYYADIDCTSMTGTNPTMDVEVCELDEYSNERILGCFTQLTAVADQRVGISPPIGRGVYVKYTKGGTVTDCDFRVYLTGMR